MKRSVIIFSALFLSLNAFATIRIELKTTNQNAFESFAKNNSLDLGHGALENGRYEVFVEDRSVLDGLPKDTVIISEEESTALGLNDNNSYWDTKKTYQEMRELSTKNSLFAHLINLNQALKIKSTEDKNSLLALKVGKTSQLNSEKKKILIIGQHHARELMTHHAVFDMAKDYLAKIRASDPNSLALLDRADVWFVPVVNPDGLNFVFDKNNMWRKNRKENKDGTFGIDLNRNYGFGWAKCGSNSKSPGSDIYVGEKPFSEVETNIMNLLNKKLKAQYVISYHSSGNEVLFPYKCGNLAEAKVIYDVRDRLASRLGFGKRVASSSGEDFEHHYNKHGSIAFLLEIGKSFQPKFSEYTSTVKPTILKVLPFLAEELKKPFLEIKVSAQDGTPIKGVSVNIKELNFTEGEVLSTDELGIFRRRVMGGEYNLELTKPGMKTLIKKIQINQSSRGMVFLEMEFKEADL